MFFTEDLVKIIDGLGHITDLMVHFRALCCFSSYSPKFLHVALNSLSKRCSNVYPLLYTSFCVENKTLAHVHSFLLQTKCEAADKTLGKRFLKEIKATCKNVGESELNPEKAI